MRIGFFETVPTGERVVLKPKVRWVQMSIKNPLGLLQEPSERLNLRQGQCSSS